MSAAEFARALGVELMPWQVAVLDRIERDPTRIVLWPRRTGLRSIAAAPPPMLLPAPREPGQK